jgi:hypothetical protein
MSCTYEYHRDHRWAVYDRHGIFYTYVCPKCRGKKISPAQYAYLEVYDAEEPLDD